jgi:hypothetical protein
MDHWPCRFTDLHAMVLALPGFAGDQESGEKILGPSRWPGSMSWRTSGDLFETVLRAFRDVDYGDHVLPALLQNFTPCSRTCSGPAGCSYMSILAIGASVSRWSRSRRTSGSPSLRRPDAAAHRCTRVGRSSIDFLYRGYNRSSRALGGGAGHGRHGTSTREGHPIPPDIPAVRELHD